MAHNVWWLGEVALWVGFERWEAILPNPCYMKCRLVSTKLDLKTDQKKKRKKSDGKF